MYTNKIEPDQIAVATGSVTGAMHRRLGRGNQDAVSVRITPAGVALVVCDGCGSGARSEVGATIGAQLWTAAIARWLERDPKISEAGLAGLASEVLAGLAPVAAALGDDLVAVCREHLLFTSVCAVITTDRVIVAAIGDGLVALGDQQQIVGPFPDNAPPYLVESWFGAPPCARTWSCARADVDRVVVATDGAIALAGPPLADLTELAIVYRNPAALTRRLRLLADDSNDIEWVAQRVDRRRAVLDDDTTIACARWSRT
jgi:Protein phosphatase 2C